MFASKTSSISALSDFNASFRRQAELALMRYDISDIYPSNGFVRFVKNSNLKQIERILGDKEELKSYVKRFNTTEPKLLSILNQIKIRLERMSIKKLSGSSKSIRFSGLNDDVKELIFGKIEDVYSYRLRDWIDEDKLISMSIRNLCKNPSIGASELLKSLIDRKKILPEQLYFDLLAKQNNRKALKLIDRYCDDIDKYILRSLCKNPNPTAIKLLNKHLSALIELFREEDYLVPHVSNNLYLNSNPNISKIIKKLKAHTQLKDVYDIMSQSTNTKYLELLKDNQDKINWQDLSQNESDIAIEILKDNKDKIQDTILKNPNKEAIGLFPEIKTAQHLIYLCMNSNSQATELFIKKYKEPRFRQMIEKPQISREVWFHFGLLNNDTAMQFFRDNIRNIKAEVDPLYYILNNPNKIAVEMILDRLNSIDKTDPNFLDFMIDLCQNPSETVIKALEFHQELKKDTQEPLSTIYWLDIGCNPAIFEVKKI